MSKRLHGFGLRVINGQDRSFSGRVVRAGTSVIEPLYSGVMRLRNWCYDRGLKKTHALGRPTISVGNITTGGTGKTPVVLWLAGRLRGRGFHPAVLLRGYGSTAPGISDEQQLLDTSLNDGSNHPIPVRANPSRIASAALLLREDPSIDLFILDDAFQHRTARRDFDLVLVSATEPFGYGHVLPRGLLREPLAGLRRASALMITRSSHGIASTVEPRLRAQNAAAPIYRSNHVHSSIWMQSNGQHLPINTLNGRRLFVFAGIGDPDAFISQLKDAGGEIAGHRRFVDHHAYTAKDVEELINSAGQVDAALLVTTRKDWVKLTSFASLFQRLPIGVVEMSIEMSQADEFALLDQIEKAIRVPTH